MNKSDPLNELRETLKGLRQDEDITVMSVAGLLHLLDTSTPAREWIAKLRRWELEERATSQSNIEMFRSVMGAAHAALKSALLINGAAAAGILTFVGSLVERRMNIGLFVWAMAFFGSGVFLAALASGGTYLAQRKYHAQLHLKESARCNCWTGVTVVVVILSYVAFAVGVGFSAWGIWLIAK